MKRRSATPLLLGTFLLRVCGGASNVILGLFLVALAPKTGHIITSIQVGLLPVAFFATELTLAPIMGSLSDRWGRRGFLIFGPFIGVIQVGLIVLTPIHYALPYLFGLQIISGISSAMQVPAVLGYLADFTVTSPARRMRLMSFFELVTSGGIAAGVVLGGFAWDRFGRYAFLLLAALYLLVVLCMVITPRVLQAMESGSFQSVAIRYWRIVRTPRLFLFIPAWISICALVGIWLSSQITFILSSPSYKHEQLLMGSIHGHGSGGRLSLVLGSFVIFFGLCLIFWAFYMSRVPRLRLMLTSVGGIFLFCIALVGINHRGPGNDWLLLVWIPVLLIGVFMESSFAPAALAYLADISEEAARDRGLLMGLYSVFLGLGQLLGNGLGGVFAHTWGFDGLIYLTILFALISLCSLLILFRVEGHRFASQIQPPNKIETSVGS